MCLNWEELKKTEFIWSSGESLHYGFKTKHKRVEIELNNTFMCSSSNSYLTHFSIGL